MIYLVYKQEGADRIMLNIEKGQRAKAIVCDTHNFKDGAEIVFIGMSTYKDDGNDVYIFHAISQGLTQELIESEFELISE